MQLKLEATRARMADENRDAGLTNFKDYLLRRHSFKSRRNKDCAKKEREHVEENLSVKLRCELSILCPGIVKHTFTQFKLKEKRNKRNI